MKKLNLLALILALGGIVLAQAQSAPPVINYQGRLTQATGAVVPDGLAGMRVRIFATASGGSALWDSGDISVATKSGTFSILLGSGGMPTMSPAVFALGTVYVEVQPAGQAPLLPRQPIASVPWAFWAHSSVTVVDGAITTPKLADDAVTPQKTLFPFVKTVNTGPGEPALRINNSGSGVGVFGSSVDYIGVLGTATGTNPFSFGVRGEHATSGNLGILGGPGYGVFGSSASHHAGKFEGAVDVTTRLTVGGRVGIGTVDPQAKLSLGGEGGKTLQFDHSGANWAISTQSDQDISLYARSFNLIGSSSGLLYCTNNTALKPGGGPWADLNSDRRLKTDISPMDDALRMLLSLRGVNYRFKDPKSLNERPGMRRGFIAQEVEATFPEWVVTKPNGYKTISFDSGFDALTVEAFREQQSQIEKLRQENEQLRRQNAAFESRLRSIEAKLKH